MASAILANRNGHQWGEGRLCTKNNHNSNSHTRCPNPNPDDQIFDCLSQIHGGSNSELANDIPSDDSSSLNWKSIGLSPRKDPYVELVKFNVVGYTRRELKELKKRLVSELEQVRALINRIDSNDFTGSNGSKEKPFPKKTNKHSQSQTLEFGNKIVSGTKRPYPSDSSRESKRVVAEIGSGKLYLDTMKKCEQILTKLMKTKCSWIFNIPVDAAKLQLHDYHQIIKNPMDLGTIKEKLKKNLYKSPNDFASDVRLTFDNAMLYNPRGHDVYRFAEQLLGKFEELFNSLCAKYNLEQRSMTKEEKVRNQYPATLVIPEKNHVDIPAKETTQSIHPVLKQSTGRKQPKPKAKDPNKREMSYEEKQKLGLSLQDLPQEKLDQVLQIIQRRNSNVPENGNEIELDLDIMDTETLWELDRFVYNCKKAMSKIKRQSLADGRTSSVATVIASQETIHRTKLQDNQEEDVDIGEYMPSSDFPPVQIEKDDANGRQSSSSDSSSSDSSSSSSDSDSESSSGSDSDGDDKKSPFVGSKISPKT